VASELPIEHKRANESFPQTFERLQARREAFFQGFQAKFDRFKDNQHAVPLGSPLTEAEIAAFEGGQFRIPKDYRDFLLRIGDGGFCKYTMKRLCDVSAQRAAKPFLWTRTVGVLLEDFEQNDPRVATPAEALHPDMKDVDVVELWESGDPMQGTIELCCSFYLIVNGPYRGHIWTCGDYISSVYCPFNPADNPMFAQPFSEAEYGAVVADKLNNTRAAALDAGPVCDFIGLVSGFFFQQRNWS